MSNKYEKGKIVMKYFYFASLFRPSIRNLALVKKSSPTPVIEYATCDKLMIDSNK